MWDGVYIKKSWDVGRSSSEFSSSCLCRAGSGRQQEKQGVPDATLNSSINISSTLYFSTGRKIFIRTLYLFEGWEAQWRSLAEILHNSSSTSNRTAVTATCLYSLRVARNTGKSRGRRAHSSSYAATRRSWFPPGPRGLTLMSRPPCVGTKRVFRRSMNKI